VLYDFLFNKWYFDELYNADLRPPAFCHRPQFWKRGDEGTIDRFGPNGMAALVVAGQARRAGSSPAISTLCAGDAPRPRRCGNLGIDGEQPGMNELGFPILSLMLAVPMAGALLCLSFRPRRRGRSRWSPRWPICLGFCSGSISTRARAMRSGSFRNMRQCSAASPGRWGSTASR
jgi:hypothetical protein